MRIALLSFLLASNLTFSFQGHAQEAEGSQWISLFDGETLDGWEGLSKYWSVEEGAITAQSIEVIPSNTFLIYQNREFSDFELEFQFKIFSGNSGVQFRSVQVEPKKNQLPFQVKGYQADFDAKNNWSGTIYSQGRGILAKRGTRTISSDAKEPISSTEISGADSLAKKILPLGSWNTYRVKAIGNKLSYSINGTLMAETEDQGATKASSSGIIALQLHSTKQGGMKVQFRNIKILEH